MKDETICPECSEEVEICDMCGDIIHFEQKKVWMSAGVFCGNCHTEILGRCARRRVEE